MRVLIIRFSSFGDIFQALEAARHLKKVFPSTPVDWLVRDDFAALLEKQFSIDHVHRFDRKASPLELAVLAWRIAGRYDHVYDAHSNLRSLIVRMVIHLRWAAIRVRTPFAPGRSMIVRSKERLRRFLFFRLRLPTLPVPYRGAESYVRPLRRWCPDLEFDFSERAWQAPKLADENIGTVAEFRKWRAGNPEATLIALAPSAAWPNKRWPVERWRLFVQEWMTSSPGSLFLLLGGPEDRFLDAIESEFSSHRVFNAVGRTSLLESSVLLGQADDLVANDTGLLHVADRLQIPSVEIVGPTAFGYPVSPVSRVAEVPRETLRCKPCSKDGRDPCINPVHLKCLLDVSPAQVVRELRAAFEDAGEERARP